MAFNSTLNLQAMEPLTPTRILATAPGGGQTDLNTLLGFTAGQTIPFRKLWLKGNSNYQTKNTGTIYVGFGTGANTMQFEILPGEEKEIVAPVGARLDLKDLSVEATGATDSLLVILYR